MPGKAGMKWASALSTESGTGEAIQEAAGRIAAELKGARPDVAFVFASPHHRSEFSRMPAMLAQHLNPAHMLGCSGGGIIGAGRELEKTPALSITAAVLPGVDVTPFHLDDESLPGPDDPPRRWEDVAGVRAADDPQFVILADPFSMTRAEDLLRGMDFAFPQAVKIGGLASGANGRGKNALFLDQRHYPTGAVGLAFSGNVALETMVAQGCRPIGRPMQITRCSKNLLIELDKKPALSEVADLFEHATEQEQELIRTSLFLGIVMDPFKSGEPRPGDFLIRNLVGLDANRGVLAVGALLDEGQTVQFHLREAGAASADLSAVLRRYTTERLNATKGEAMPVPPRGALLFSCLGRGEHLYDKPNHDSNAFASEFGEVPLGGFFCNGEIGPVGGTTYLHGFTSCFAIFRNKS